MPFDAKKAKFIFRALLTVAIMFIGAAIFFTSTKPETQIIGTNMITLAFSAWLSTGSGGSPAPARHGDELV